MEIQKVLIQRLEKHKMGESSEEEPGSTWRKCPPAARCKVNSILLAGESSTRLSLGALTSIHSSIADFLCDLGQVCAAPSTKGLDFCWSFSFTIITKNVYVAASYTYFKHL